MKDPYLWSMLICGVGMMGAAWLPSILRGRPLSLPMLCLAVGVLGSLVPWAGELAGALRDVDLIEKFSESCVLISLASAGFSLDREFTWKAWLLPRRLLLVTMPLTIVGVMALSYGLLDLPLASALLLGAVLAPTDPVLANDVQVEGPNEPREDQIKFALTSEASLNDGLAFPFTAAAIAWAGHEGWSWVGEWAAYDLLYRVVMGVLAGGLVGYAIARFTFDVLHPRRLTHVTASMLVLGLTAVTYALTEYVHGYGFLAVFVSAMIVRRYHKRHEYHNEAHDLATQIEHVLMVFFLMGFGLLLGTASWESVDVTSVVVAVVLLCVIRPLAGWIGLLGQREADARSRVAMSFLGIKGIGSVYYLAYAFNHQEFAGSKTLWTVVSLTMVGSIILHGVSANFLVERACQSGGKNEAKKSPEKGQKT